MNKNELLKNLNENMQNLENVENEISMIELAIYQKNISKLKNLKINELREFFEQKSSYYNQKIEKFECEIEKNINKYKEELEKLINVYDYVYINIFKIMQNAMNNQKIAIANIVTLEEKLQNDKLNDEETHTIKNTILACAQKKLNYAVIIDECKARIKWCIESIQSDINNLFICKVNQMQIYNDNIFNKIIRVIHYKMLGKKEFKEFLKKYEKEYTKNVITKNNVATLNIITTLKGIQEQVKVVRNQIDLNYRQMIYN